MKNKLLASASFILIATFPLSVFAKDGRVNPNGRNVNRGTVNTHVGEMDTDGILSPGELRNPNINYNRGVYSRDPYYYDHSRSREYDRRQWELAQRERELAQRERELYDRRPYYDDDWMW